MSNNRTTDQDGFSLVEVLVAIGLIALSAGMILPSLFEANKNQALDKNVQIIASALDRARSSTLASDMNSQYGVRIEADKVVIFQGDIYTAGNPTNFVESLNSLVSISSTSISGGGSEVVFERLTGKTANHGTIELSLNPDPSRTKIITILPTGLVETN